MASAIFLLTDFGDRDAYVGVMKAVMLGIAPDVRIVDLCHGIEPQDIVSAAYVLLTAVPYVPEGSVVVAVVDPGVGSDRRIVAMEFECFWVIAPDNGLATLVLDRYPMRTAFAVEWERLGRPTPSATFHGRDIFAPAAALLASGAWDAARLGRRVEGEMLLRLDLQPAERNGSIVGRILHRDRFGNLVTNVEAVRWNIEPHAGWLCDVGSETVPLVRTYSDVPLGEPLAYVGSSGFIEIAVRSGSAQARFGNTPAVSLRRPPAD
jgi:hypothetical protein